MTRLEAGAAEYFASAGPMTDLADCDPALLEGLGGDPARLCRLAEGLVVHEFWADAYGLVVSDERRKEVCIRPAAEVLRRAGEMDRSAITQARPPERRVTGNCRMFSTLTVALLRRAGVPARARCGFGGYFEQGKMLDHWIVEYLVAGGRWWRVDPQIDELQRRALGLDFDPDDMPEGEFVAAPGAWIACRQGDDDPERYGILDMWGLWFIRGNVLRDLASLNKVELLPWDTWGLMEPEAVPDDGLIDEVARTIVGGDLSEIRAIYDANVTLRVPATIHDERCGESWAVPQPLDRN